MHNGTIKIHKEKTYPEKLSKFIEMLDHLSNFIRKLLWPHSLIAN